MNFHIQNLNPLSQSLQNGNPEPSVITLGAFQPLALRIVLAKNSTSARAEDGSETEVCYLDHHAVIHHTICGLQASMDLNIAGVEVRHALDSRQNE